MEQHAGALSTEKAAHELGVAPKTVRALIGAGLLDAFDVSSQPGRKVWRIRRDEIRNFQLNRKPEVVA